MSARFIVERWNLDLSLFGVGTPFWLARVGSETRVEIGRRMNSSPVPRKPWNNECKGKHNSTRSAFAHSVFVCSRGT